MNFQIATNLLRSSPLAAKAEAASRTLTRLLEPLPLASGVWDLASDSQGRAVVSLTLRDSLGSTQAIAFTPDELDSPWAMWPRVHRAAGDMLSSA